MRFRVEMRVEFAVTTNVQVEAVVAFAVTTHVQVEAAVVAGIHQRGTPCRARAKVPTAGLVLHQGARFALRSCLTYAETSSIGANYSTACS